MDNIRVSNLQANVNIHSNFMQCQLFSISPAKKKRPKKKKIIKYMFSYKKQNLNKTLPPCERFFLNINIYMVSFM